VNSTKLIIVIHAEEEFDWDSGFYRSQIGMSYADNLMEVMDLILALGAKVTLAMDYPFVTSDGGRKIINQYKHCHGDSVEFATHLHPWVNPPFENQDDQVSNELSYPGNLPEEFEHQKIKVLTETIENVTGFRPHTYLAGRYGIGKNTQGIIERLGYQMDLSISAYCDFSHQQGPDFSHYTNKKFQKNQITYVPHTSSVLSALPWVTRYLNQRPELFTQIQSNRLIGLMGKCLRIKKYRLSPEGFTFKQMRQVTKAQLNVGQDEFIMSFHSPSTKAGLTPYVSDDQDLETFKTTITEYITWFKSLERSRFCLAQELV
jgi:hypothetical protein